MVANNNKSVLPNVLAIGLVAWLLFFNGFSQLRTMLESGAFSRAASTVKTGVDRVTGPAARQPAVKPPAAAQQPAAPASQPVAETQPDTAAPAVVAPLSTLPTAVILIPTVAPVAQVVVVPQAMPVLEDTRPTLAPTMVYPTPLPAAIANAYTLSDDGKCITVERSGAQYQNCQPDPFTPGAARSVADLMRTGVIPGTKVE